MFKYTSGILLAKFTLFPIIILCLFYKILFIDKVSLKELIFYLLFVGIAVIVSIKSGNRQILTLSLLIISSKNINFRYILLTFLIIVPLLLFITFLFSQANIIPNLQYFRVREGELKIRNSYGMIYPTIFAAYLQYIVIGYSYFMRKNSLSHITFIILSILCFFICLYMADARMSAYSIVLYLFIFYFCSLFFRNIGQYKILSTLTVFIFPLFFCAIYFLSAKYDPSSSILETINSALSGRLRLAHSALETYDIPLLGQEIKFVGLGGAVQDMGEDYNYVDSSFLQFLLSYGTIFSIFSTLLMMVITWKRIKLSDYRFLAIIIILSFNSMIEDRLLDISVNIYWLLALAYYNNTRIKHD